MAVLQITHGFPARKDVHLGAGGGTRRAGPGSGAQDLLSSGKIHLIYFFFLFKTVWRNDSSELNQDMNNSTPNYLFFI